MVRTYKRKTSRGAEPDALVRAADEVLNQGHSFRTVAVAYGIDKMTLYRYCTKLKKSASQVSPNVSMSALKVTSGYARPRQTFSDVEEGQLVQYLLNAAKMFFGLSPKETKKLAFQYAVNLGIPLPKNWTDNSAAGEDWFSGFMRRHVRVLSVRAPEATSLNRATSFNRTNTNWFYDNLEDLYRRFHFEPQSIWNADETGLTTAQNPCKIIAPKGVKQVGAITSAERGVLVTMCCAVNALGHAIPPMYIFPRVRYHERLVDGGPPGCVGASHKSGWMTADNFLLFLQHFAKHSKSTVASPVLLLLDNHESHVALQCIQFAKDNGIHLLSFPPHCSHRLQPLDCSVYFPLKRYFNAQSDAWCNSHPGRPMQALDIPSVSAPAFKMAMTPSNIQSGFEVTGIYPFNRNRIPDDEFLPSSVTDRPDPTVVSGGLPIGTEQGSSLSMSNLVTPLLPQTLDHLPASSTLAQQPTPALQQMPTAVEQLPASSTPAQQPTPVQHQVPMALEQLSASSTPAQQPTPAQHQVPSAVEQLPASSTPTTSGYHLSPCSLYDIRPLPKAGPRTGKQHNRKRGRTRILTDTPEKLLIEQETALRQLLKQPKRSKQSASDNPPKKTISGADSIIKEKATSAGKKPKLQKNSKGKEKAKKIKETESSHCSKTLLQDIEHQISDDEEFFCLKCSKPYSKSKPGEDWIQCLVCELWAHLKCAKNQKNFICNECK